MTQSTFEKELNKRPITPISKRLNMSDVLSAQSKARGAFEKDIRKLPKAGFFNKNAMVIWIMENVDKHFGIGG